MQQPTIRCMPESMKARLTEAMSSIVDYQKRIVEKNLLCFCRRDRVFFDTLASIAIVPVKTSDNRPINHTCIL